MIRRSPRNPRAALALVALFVASSCSAAYPGSNNATFGWAEIASAASAAWGRSAQQLTQGAPANATSRRLSSNSGGVVVGQGCTMTACNGVNLPGEIKKDLQPWAAKGGITARDIDAAEKALQKVDGYIRVSIVDGKLHASHLGKSWGTRDGVFLVSLLEMIRKDPKLLPKQVCVWVYTPRLASQIFTRNERVIVLFAHARLLSCSVCEIWCRLCC